MADYPCDNHLARYSGPSHRVYLNVYREDQAAKFKASLCADCLSDLVSFWLERALHQAQAGNWDPGHEGQQLEDLWMDTGAAGRPLNGRVRY